MEFSLNSPVERRIDSACSPFGSAGTNVYALEFLYLEELTCSKSSQCMFSLERDYERTEETSCDMVVLSYLEY